jgi:hypothetical protein
MHEDPDESRGAFLSQSPERCRLFRGLEDAKNETSIPRRNCRAAATGITVDNDGLSHEQWKNSMLGSMLDSMLDSMLGILELLNDWAITELGKMNVYTGDKKVLF